KAVPVKRETRCSESVSAARKLGFGFSGTDELYCSERGGTVDPDDGCTFAARGQPMVGINYQDVILGEHAAVHGCH
ncbi:hypothetical protein, partial [Gordonibacter sp.]|uniref:hypothetical protein n=1 Tax=Gordonibacter sp. TaxID=1968902 RepID=UPI002FC9372A